MNGWVHEAVVMDSDASRSDGVALGCVFGTCAWQFVTRMPDVGFNMGTLDVKIRLNEPGDASSSIKNLWLCIPLACLLHGSSYHFSIVVNDSVPAMRCGGDLHGVQHA